jgi:[ribosomal protein S18]-alanine N-acetyltransferase
MALDRRRLQGSQIAIRPGIPADLPSLAAIENEAFASDRLSQRALARHLRSRTALVLVAAAAAGTVVGYALLLFRREATVARLYSLAVDPAARGRGLARRLIAAAEEAASSRGARVLRLEVGVDNAPAIRLYEELGYRCFARTAGYYEDRADALRYQKPLARST